MVILGTNEEISPRIVTWVHIYVMNHCLRRQWTIDVLNNATMLKIIDPGTAHDSIPVLPSVAILLCLPRTKGNKTSATELSVWSMHNMPTPCPPTMSSTVLYVVRMDLYKLPTVILHELAYLPRL